MNGPSPKILESNLWKWLKSALAGTQTHAERLENMVGSGTPDVDLCRDRVVVRVELKTCARPSRSSTKLAVKVRPTQPPWHSSWTRVGGLSVFLVQVGSGSSARRYALPGAFGRRLADRLTEAELAALSTVVERDTAFDDVVRAAESREASTETILKWCTCRPNAPDSRCPVGREHGNHALDSTSRDGVLTCRTSTGSSSHPPSSSWRLSSRR